MIILAVLGIVVAHPTMNLPAFTGFGGINGNSQLFPVLFITVACGTTYRFIVSGGFDTNGKRITHKKTWKPPEGMTARQIEKAVQRAAVDFERYLGEQGVKVAAYPCDYTLNPQGKFNPRWLVPQLQAFDVTCMALHEYVGMGFL